MDGSTAAVKPKAKLKGNKKEEKDKNPKGKVGKGKGEYSNCLYMFICQFSGMIAPWNFKYFIVILIFCHKMIKKALDIHEQ